MKEFTFSSGNAAILQLKELPKPKKKKLNTDRVLFLALLAIILIYALVKLYQGIALIQVDGMVTMDKLSVNFSEDIRILDINIREGADISHGDTLFTYRNQYFENDANYFSMQVSNQERMNRDRRQIEMDIRQKEAERDYHLQTVEMLTNESNETARLVALAVYPKTMYEQANQRLRRAEIDLQKTEKELLILKQEREKLLQSESSNINRSIPDGFQNTRFYKAPFNGIVGQISVQENEISYKANEVLTIHQPNKTKIQAYFPQSAIDYISIGETVELSFPNGETRQGVIEQYYIATYELPDEFQKSYEPTERGILVDILPFKDSDDNDWKKFYKMSVTVSVGRFF